MYVKKLLAAISCGILLMSIAILADGGSIVNSKHDISIWDKSTTTEPCVFCHTPHGSNTIAPLWNRNTPASNFTMYNSPTMDTSHPGQPNGITLACLGCHDGVLSDVGEVINAPGSGLGDGVGCKQCHVGIPPIYIGEGGASLGVDFSNDHPISINYPTPQQDDQFNQPTQTNNRWFVVSGGISLPLFYGNSKYIECATCHNVHNPDIVPFLRASNSESELCNTCHIK